MYSGLCPDRGDVEFKMGGWMESLEKFPHNSHNSRLFGLYWSFFSVGSTVIGSLPASISI